MGKTLQKPIQRGLSPRHAPAPRSAPAPAGLPNVVAARELPDPVTISVICPTFNRHGFHEALYRTFTSQDHPAKDLWVLDETSVPSPFFTALGDKDPSVHYLHAQRTSIGHARNTLIQSCSGSVVAHFDDDDVYAPHYLSSMLDQLRRADADLVKLASWNERNEKNGDRWRYEGHRRPQRDLWGWGFSYMYRRYVTTRVSFPTISHAEDYQFVQSLWAQGLRTHLVRDGADWVEKRYSEHERRA
jgi:glycosyltransferase involved in cell wall biosynthesis